MKKYKKKFYEKRHEKTHYAATTILSIVLEAVPNIRSVVDIGCGAGTWLHVLKESGIDEIQGIDGEWVDRDSLVIPLQNLLVHDLNAPISSEKRYDLAICLEVAEHLRPENAATLVASLCQLADVVLFSAAIPYQGGKNHINEQWPAYWSNLFKSRGYLAFDIIRKRIWDDSEIQTWYKQNTLLYVKSEKASEIRCEDGAAKTVPLSLVHPDTYVGKMKRTTSVRGSWKLFRRALKTYFWRKRSKNRAEHKPPPSYFF